MATNGFQFCFINPLVDSEDFVLKIKEKALRLYMEGTVRMEWAGEGVSSGKQFAAPVESILAECNRALKLINPGRYGHVVRQSAMRRFG